MIRTCLLLLCLCCTVAGAQTPQPTTDDPVANKRAVALSEELRCLVCQNQSIAESNAELAVDLRRQIREQIADGRDEKQIIDYMVERYGDFVLYRPPVKGSTLMLWLGPFALLVGAAITLVWVVRRRARTTPPATTELSPAQRERLQQLLKD